MTYNANLFQGFDIDIKRSLEIIYGIRKDEAETPVSCVVRLCKSKRGLEALEIIIKNLKPGDTVLGEIILQGFSQIPEWGEAVRLGGGDITVRLGKLLEHFAKSKPGAIVGAATNSSSLTDGPQNELVV